MSATSSPATSGVEGGDPTGVRGAAHADGYVRAATAAAGPRPAPLILAIDPGSSSTKIALFAGDAVVHAATLPHQPLAPDATTDDALAPRLAAVEEWLASTGTEPATLAAIVGRGGLVRPVEAGTYTVTDDLVADLRAGVRGRHAANLGGLLARAVADAAGVPAFVVDPVAVDEFSAVARVAGIAQLHRESLLHALNVRAVARADCAARGVRLEDAHLVVAHLGTGFSIVAIERGRLVDANNAHEEGPFTPERCGGLPAAQLAQLVHDGRLPDWPAARDFLHVRGGLTAYLGTGDLPEIERRIAAGDDHAAEVLAAMAYQIGKSIGAYAAALAGHVDAILLTGGVARSERVVAGVREMVQWIAPVRVHPGEDELAALAEGARRALDGTEPARDYGERP